MITPSPRLADLPRYRAGKSAAAVAAEHGLGSAVKLASNEAPFGPLPGVIEAVAATLADVNRYPDPTSEAVAERYAARVGVARDRVAVGPGSVGLLEQLALAYVEPGEEVLFGWPTFIAYPQFTRLVGATMRTVPLRRQTIDVDALLAAATERTRLVLVANPNNPTSTALRSAQLTRLVDGLPETCLVVIDEAYHEFTTAADVPDAVDTFVDRPNVAVTRTMSKAYGLAGLRIGFLVAQPDVIDAVEACALPFGVTGAAQAAALAAFDQDDEVTRRCAVVTGERDRVAQELRRRGLGVPDSQGNYWWLPAGTASGALTGSLEARGVVPRTLDGGVRVTIGTPADNDRFLGAFDDVIAGDAEVTAGWAGATGDEATKAAGWIERLDAAVARLRAHLGVDHPGRTDPVPGEEETWDAGQVWAHVAEFGDYWFDQLAVVLDADSTDPVPFGRTRRDPVRIAAIQAGRDNDPAEHLAAAERSADRLRALLAELTDEDWARAGKHETLGVMDLDAQLTHFHVGHYEEHADQLDSIREPEAEPS